MYGMYRVGHRTFNLEQLIASVDTRSILNGIGPRVLTLHFRGGKSLDFLGQERLWVLALLEESAVDLQAVCTQEE